MRNRWETQERTLSIYITPQEDESYAQGRETKDTASSAPQENTLHQLNRPEVAVRSDTGCNNTPRSQQGVSKHSRFKAVSLTHSLPKDSWFQDRMEPQPLTSKSEPSYLANTVF